MADRGFDIDEDLGLIGARFNMPPFSKGKEQFTEYELVETRRIAYLRIHVERAKISISFTDHFHYHSEYRKSSLFHLCCANKFLSTSVQLICVDIAA